MQARLEARSCVSRVISYLLQRLHTNISHSLLQRGDRLIEYSLFEAAPLELFKCDAGGPCECVFVCACKCFSKCLMCLYALTCAFLCALVGLFTLVCAITLTSVHVTCLCALECEWAADRWKCCLCIFMQSNYVDLIGFVYVESVSPPVMYYCRCGQTLIHTYM